MIFENILVESAAPGVRLIRLNRPEVLNALNNPLMEEVGAALAGFEADPEVQAVVITGSDKAFAAGADVAQMATFGTADALEMFATGCWEAPSRFAKPLIAAVGGLALGGGFELVLQCDIVVAAETARFGLPEVNLGVIPGAGGTQRITACVGKSMAMEMVLNGRSLTASEALQLGVASRVVPAEELLEEALELARQIAVRAPMALRLGKGAVKQAAEEPLRQGLLAERASFCMIFGTEDQTEGMQAFLERRRPTWVGR